MKFKNKLIGERIVLKKSKPSFDLAEKIFLSIDKNRAHLKEWFPWESETKKIEDSMKYLFETEEREKKFEELDYGIYLENKFIGKISAFDINKKNQRCEIGYWLSKDFINKGYMTEAVKVLEKYLFEDVKINRIQIRCDIRNIASASVAKKCGYVFEGELREVKYNLLKREYISEYVFSKLKKEYKPKKSRK